jgi:hypothetical protein
MANMTINQLFEEIEKKGLDREWDSDKVHRYNHFVRELISNKLIDMNCGFPENNGEVMAELFVYKKRKEGNYYEMIDEIYLMTEGGL